MTNILDPKHAPAPELAALHHERWEIEGAFDEFKTHPRANSTVLRSKTPDLVLARAVGAVAGPLRHLPIEIARGRCVSSRGRFNPRGVKRKMRNFKVRHRGELLHQQHQPTPVLRI